MKNYLRQNSAVLLIGGALLCSLAATMALFVLQGRRVEIRTERRIDALAELVDARMEETRFQSQSGSTAGCDRMIVKVPVRLDRPGRYCLARMIDYEAGRDAILIMSDNVVIDGMGYTLAGPSDSATTARGIRAIDRSGITVTNIRITGFNTAVQVGETATQIAGTSMRPSNHASRDIRISGVRIDNATFHGIHVRADNFSITDSTIAGIGPSTVNPHSFATGIFARGNACEISRNRLTLGEPTGTGENIGIGLYLGDACRIENNTVLFDRYPEWGRSFGIWTRPEGGALPMVQHNFVSGAHYAYGPHGIFEANIATNSPCALFAVRDDPASGFMDRGANSAYQTSGVVRPGNNTCPDDIERASARYYAAPGPEAAYAIALAYAEVSSSSVVETLTWLLVAAHQGHEIAKRTAKTPEAGGYTPENVAAAQEAASQIIEGIHAD